MGLFIIVALTSLVLTHFLMGGLGWHGAASVTVFLLVTIAVIGGGFWLGSPDFRARLGIGIGGILLFVFLAMVASFLGIHGGGCDSVGLSGCIADP